MKAKICFALFFIFLLSNAFCIAGESNVSLVKTDAYIEEKDLIIELLFANTGEIDGNVLLRIYYFGQLDESKETIPKISTKLFKYKAKNIQPGTMHLAVLGDENHFIEIKIPTEISPNSQIIIKEISIEEWRKAAEENLFFRNLLLFAVLVFAIVAILLAVKVFFRKKTKKEIEIEQTEKMLGELKEIESLRKREEEKKSAAQKRKA